MRVSALPEIMLPIFHCASQRMRGYTKRTVGVEIDRDGLQLIDSLVELRDLFRTVVLPKHTEAA